MGTIASVTIEDKGAVSRGIIDLGHYSFDVYTYGGMYEKLRTTTIEPFIDPHKVIVRASTGRLDATFGDIPNLNEISQISMRYSKSQ